MSRQLCHANNVKPILSRQFLTLYLCWLWVKTHFQTFYERINLGAHNQRREINQPTSQPWRPKIHVLCKVGKNIIFQNKTLLVMLYRHNKTFWYQFCNFEHFLEAENSEDSLASLCVEFSAGLSCNPVWDWVTIGTKVSIILLDLRRFQTEVLSISQWWVDQACVLR